MDVCCSWMPNSTTLMNWSTASEFQQGQQSHGPHDLIIVTTIISICDKFVFCHCLVSCSLKKKPFPLIHFSFMATANKRLDVENHSKAICQMTKSMRYVASFVCFQYLVVWEMLSHAQTTFLATTVSALTRAKFVQTVLILTSSTAGSI